MALLDDAPSRIVIIIIITTATTTTIAAAQTASYVGCVQRRLRTSECRSLLCASGAWPDLPTRPAHRDCHAPWTQQGWIAAMAVPRHRWCRNGAVGSAVVEVKRYTNIAPVCNAAQPSQLRQRRQSAAPGTRTAQYRYQCRSHLARTPAVGAVQDAARDPSRPRSSATLRAVDRCTARKMTCAVVPAVGTSRAHASRALLPTRASVTLRCSPASGVRR